MVVANPGAGPVAGVARAQPFDLNLRDFRVRGCDPLRVARRNGVAQSVDKRSRDGSL